MKRVRKYFITGLISFAILSICSNVSAAKYCDDFNNDESACNSNTNCVWTIYNEDSGDSYCKLKSNLNEFNYSVEIFNGNIEGNKSICTFNIILEKDSIVEISWKDPYYKTSGSLNSSQVSFDCAGRTVNFWNTNLDNPLQQETNGEYLYDFKSTFLKHYQKTNKAPQLNFVNQNGNYNVYFTDSNEDGKEPWGTGGSQIAEDPNKPNNDDENITPDKNAQVCDVIPEDIKNYIMQALRLIRWIGLVLLIVLGALDFVKAAASDDQDAMKKASQNFIKRLIAVIILFLLPMLVELILFIIGKLGFNFGECYNISEF